MKKKIFISIFCLVIITILLIVGTKLYINKKEAVVTNAKTNIENEAQEGMKVTLIGGSKYC